MKMKKEFLIGLNETSLSKLIRGSEQDLITFTSGEKESRACHKKELAKVQNTYRF